MKVLDLFSGIGGFSLGLERAGMETVAFCEIDPYCQKVLKKNWPDTPIHGDIKTLKGDEFGEIDLICGGYPCQPFSCAGKRQGDKDDRHLWPEMLRVIKQARPTWVIAENVVGHISMGLDSVQLDLESEGYATRPVVIPAVAVDAKHRRDRIWIIAHSLKSRVWAHAGAQPPTKEECQKLQQENRETLSNDVDPLCEVVANTSSRRLSSQNQGEIQFQRRTEIVSSSKTMADAKGRAGRSGLCGSEKGEINISPNGSRWPAEPSVGRVANGIPRRVDRIRALGNAVVPQIPEAIGRAIMELNR